MRGSKCIGCHGAKEERVPVMTYITSFPTFATIQEHPVVDAIILFTTVLQHLGEQFPKEVVVWCLLEAQLSHIVHVNAEFLWSWASAKRTTTATLWLITWTRRRHRNTKEGTNLGSPRKAPQWESFASSHQSSRTSACLWPL